MQKWLGMTAADLGRGIATGQIDPVALCDTYLAAIDAHPLRDRIFARVTHDRARGEARAASARAKAGQRRSPLDGVPISWKDLFDTAGIGTEAGTKLLAGRVPEQDALVLQNATAAGLVCLGKVHMSEIAFSGLGYNPSTATPPCVNDADAVPGGSSSGSTASVAFGLAAASIGSDTGGSVRIPAAWNDLVGFKTTHGRLSLEGLVPLALKFDTIGPLCRSVEDAALLTAALEGSKAPDLRGASLKGRRLAIVETVLMEGLRDAPKAAFALAVAKLEAAGAIIEVIEVPAVQQALDVSGMLITCEAYGLWMDVIEAAPDKMYEEILRRFRLGRDCLGSEYVASWAKLDVARQAYDASTAGYDAVISPSSAIMPPNLKRLNTDHKYYVSENLLALRNTRIGNLLGLCGLTLPTGTPSCGLMLQAAPDMDNALLRLGAAAEMALA